MTKILYPESDNYYKPDGPLVRRAIERINNRYSSVGGPQDHYVFQDVNALYAAIKGSDTPDLPRIGLPPAWLRQSNKGTVHPTPWMPWCEWYQQWVPIPTYTDDMLLRIEVAGAHDLTGHSTLTPDGWYVPYNAASKKAQVFGLEANVNRHDVRDEPYTFLFEPAAAPPILKDLVDQTRAYNLG